MQTHRSNCSTVRSFGKADRKCLLLNLKIKAGFHFAFLSFFRNFASLKQMKTLWNYIRKE